MKSLFSKRSEWIHQSEIRAMSIECEKAGGINLSQGVCDVETPLSVEMGAIDAIRSGINHYTRYDGLAELRNAIAKKMWKFNRIRTNTEKNIIVSAGSTGAFYICCLALLNPGDEVIIFEPYYGYHVSTLLAVDASPLFVKLHPPDWHFDIDELEKIVSKKTRGIMINTPANPSGKVFSKKELEVLAKFCIKHDLMIFTDEIYEYFIYDGLSHVSPGALPDIADRTFTISGYSKTFSITGWRVGYVICPEKFTKMIGFMNDLIYVCAPAPLQMGVMRGILELPESYYRKICQEYKKKRDKICNILDQVGLTPFTPQGSYYVLTSTGPLKGKTSKEKAMYLLAKTGVAAVPGSAFYSGSDGENLLRFCFAKTDEELDEACKRLLTLPV